MNPALTEIASGASAVAPAPHTRVPEIVVDSAPPGFAASIREIWNYRELLYFLMWRDVKVRYKQTVLGAAWAILQPFLAMLVFTLLFGRLAKLPSDNIPYPLF